MKVKLAPFFPDKIILIYTKKGVCSKAIFFTEKMGFGSY